MREWRRLHSKELRSVIKSRRMRLAGIVARMGDEKCVQNFRRKHEDLGGDR
jgi:hypothetical protein